MANIIMGVPPFVTPTATVLATTSAHRLFPGSRVLDLHHPAEPWQTTSVAITQDIDIDLQSARSDIGVALGWVNFPEVQIWQSNNASTWEFRTPNVVYWSHDPSNAVWTKTNATVTSNNTIPPVSSHFPAAMHVNFTAGNGSVTQLVDLFGQGISGPTRYVMWVYAVTANSISLGNGSTMTQFTLAPGWNRLETSITQSGTSFTVTVRAPTGGIIYWGGIQVTIEATSTLATIYETRGVGIYIPPNPENNRRMIYLDCKGFDSARYLRIRIPRNQVTDDSSNSYKVGAAAPIVSPVLFHGEQNYPKRLQISTPVAELGFESQNTEVAILGRIKANPRFNSGLVASQMQASLLQIARMAPGNIFVYFSNEREPEGRDSVPNPSKVYFAKISATQELNYQIPELVEVNYDFVEQT